MIAALVNGEPAEALAASDRGLHYGDGVFRTVRVAAGSAQGWPFHWQRLAQDCAQLELPCPSAEALAADMQALFGADGDGIGKIIVTRGSGGRGYTPPATAQATRLFLRHPAPEYPSAYTEQGVAIGIADIRLARQPALAGAKHLNRLEQVLARAECAKRGWPEALMRTDDGRVIGGTMSNLFAVRGNQIVTPAIIDAGVIGATRQRLIAAFTVAGTEVLETSLSLADILAADECFLCNSAMPVWPLRAVAGRRFAVGPVSRRAQALLAEPACAS